MRRFTKRRIHWLLTLMLLSIMPVAAADVSGNWTFAVTLGQLGSGNATVTLQQQPDGILTSTYTGQLANGPVSGTYSGDQFEFSFTSEALGSRIVYRGHLRGDGSVDGIVLVQDEEFGTFTGKKS